MEKELENRGDFQLFICGRALVSEMVQTYPRALLSGWDFGIMTDTFMNPLDILQMLKTFSQLNVLFFKKSWLLVLFYGIIPFAG